MAQEPEERLGMLGMGKAPERVEAFAQAGGAADTGMVVYEKQQDWLRVKSKQGTSLWVKMPQGSQFVALPDLLEGNQIYLTKEDWDQRLSATAGGPIPRAAVSPSSSARNSQGAPAQSGPCGP